MRLPSLLCLLLLACDSGDKIRPSTPPPPASAADGQTRFVDVAASVGLTWRHENGMSPDRHFPETMGGGGAFFDYDGDGDLDVYAVNGAFLATVPDAALPTNALFRNDQGRFVEIAAGVADPGCGMGVAAADYDSDGDLDLYLTNFGANALYRNDGDTFVDIAPATGTADPRWGTSCAFSDYDRDGDLDLYVVNYVDYDPAQSNADQVPYMADYDSYAGQPPAGYPHPDNFAGQADLLYRNDGNGLFADVSISSGIADQGGKGLGVVFGDYDDDGWPDIYVANDAVRNFLYRNNQDGTFAERAALAGVAYGQDGQMEAGMGVDWGDCDGDGRLDLTVTNFQAEPNALYRGEGSFFSVATFSSGLGLASLPYLGFGTQFLDFDLDGDLDLFTANGHVLDNVQDVDQSTSYGQRDLLFRNDGSLDQNPVRFAEISRDAGPGFALERVGRGSAVGDYDSDGDPDILVFNSGQPLTLLRNDQQGANHWLAVSLQGAGNNPHGIGARLMALSGALRQTRDMRGSRSYLSQSDLRIYLGLGTQPQVDRLQVRWPSGRIEYFAPVAANQYIALVEGEGFKAPPPAP